MFPIKIKGLLSIGNANKGKTKKGRVYLNLDWDGDPSDNEGIREQVELFIEYGNVTFRLD